ncbi:MAG: LacI family DNA-binding transcriptional regulator, partial [Oscillospiraceae bacterium]|nr:LacI family DNA-binding transcriptional regulator [Oscillospiraceae bacterium]
MLVTLKDIAKKTGFSVNTVSRALRGMEDISAPTRELIGKVAKEMGYISNATAASLRSGFSKVIAVIVSDISNLFFATMMKQIEDAAAQLGYTALLLNTNEDEQQELRAIQVALSQNVDGIILSAAQKSDANLDYLKKTGVPFVLIGRRNDDPEISSVVCDDELGGYLAAKHLIENGHKNVLMLHGPLYISSAKDRLNGYRRAFAEANLPVSESLIREIPVTGADEKTLAQLLAP